MPKEVPLTAIAQRAMCAQVSLDTTEKKSAVPVSGNESKFIGCPFEKQCMMRHKQCMTRHKQCMTRHKQCMTRQTVYDETQTVYDETQTVYDETQTVYDSV